MIPGPEVVFGPAPGKYTQRIMCSVCGRTGRSASGPNGWQAVCRRGHAQCACGKWLSVRQDGSPRVHARCPLKG